MNKNWHFYGIQKILILVQNIQCITAFFQNKYYLDFETRIILSNNLPKVLKSDLPMYQKDLNSPTLGTKNTLKGYLKGHEKTAKD